MLIERQEPAVTKDGGVSKVRHPALLETCISLQWKKISMRIAAALSEKGA